MRLRGWNRLGVALAMVAVACAGLRAPDAGWCRRCPSPGYPFAIEELRGTFVPQAAAPAEQEVSESQRQTLLGLVRQTAVEHGIDPRLVDAVIQMESAYRTDAVSSKGAVGLMQLMPATARRYGVADPFDPVQNVRGGTAHLRDLVDKFGVVLALAAYNAGEGAVRRHGGIPPYSETRQFIANVLGHLHD